jgi:hypothetical protein
VIDLKGRQQYLHFTWLSLLILVLSSIIIISNEGSDEVIERYEKNESEEVKMESLDVGYSPMLKPIDSEDIPLKEKNVFKRISYEEDSVIQDTGEDGYLGNLISSHSINNVRSVIPEDQSTTRASDDESDRGSILNMTEDTSTGNLSIQWNDGIPYGDCQDFYKFKAEDVDPSPYALNGTILANFTLTSYTSNSHLSERRYNENNEMLNDIYDCLWFSVKYFDEFGYSFYLIGKEFYYDNGNDNDGWTSDQNWSCNFETPIPAYTEEDMDGYSNGCTERGWYHIYIGLDYYYNSTSYTEIPQRNLSINYSFNFNSIPIDLFKS